MGWAIEHDITRGISETMFGPDNTLTKGQVATFLHRSAGALNAHGDTDSIDSRIVTITSRDGGGRCFEYATRRNEHIPRNR